MTPIDFVIFKGDNNPEDPVYKIAEAMKNDIQIISGPTKYEILSYYYFDGNMILDIEEK